MTDCSSRLPCQYRTRCGLSRPCSGWERVGRPRSNHQDAPSAVQLRGARRGEMSSPRGGSEPILTRVEKSPERERAGAESYWPCARVRCSGYPLSTSRRFNR
jgi:hypothetical protein